MTWNKIAGLFALKAILLACVLAPVPATTVGITAAQAQFTIVIPGGRHYKGRRYGQRSRRGGRGAREEAPSSTRQSEPATPEPTGKTPGN